MGVQYKQQTTVLLIILIVEPRDDEQTIYTVVQGRFVEVR